MIAYVTVGADDMARAKRFYAAFLPALHSGVTEGPEGLSYALPVPEGQPGFRAAYGAAFLCWLSSRPARQQDCPVREQPE